MQTTASILAYEEITTEEISIAIHQAVEVIQGNIQDYTSKFPAANSENGFYRQTENDDWTNGFWTGELWLAYEATKEETFKEAAKVQVESFLDRMKKRIVVDHHDMGFLYSPSCVAAYKLCGDETGKTAALLAADNLMSRFQEKGEFFQAWGQLGDKDNYRLIIDCLLNMPLLYWATQVTGDAKYADTATKHIQTAMDCVIRPDYSTYHTYYFDLETGEPLKGVTHQGNRNDSAWARGQAWGIYGTALSYKELKDPKYLDIFKALTAYFLKHLPSNLISYWDFDFDDGSAEPRDSSAVAITVCGLLEMAKYTCEEDARYYVSLAKRLVKALVSHCAVKDLKTSNGLLLHGTYVRSSKNNPCPDTGVDECNAWGDYFYLEALTRLAKDWESYW